MPRKKFADYIAEYRNIVVSVSVTITVLGVIIGFTWKTVACPLIDKRIDDKLLPINETLILQNFILMQNLSDTQLEKAQDLYLRDREIRKKHNAR